MPKKIKGEKNFGEKAEIACQKWLLSASHEELVNVFGDVASEGIQLLNVDTHKVIQYETDVKKTASGYKADTCIEFIKTGKKIFPFFNFAWTSLFTMTIKMSPSSLDFLKYSR